MRIMRSVVVFLAMALFSVPVIHGQDLSKYRTFSFGMTLADLAKQIDAKPTDAIAVHQLPALIEELTWRPRQPISSSGPAEPVQKILFSFYNGALYRMLVTYDGSAIAGANRRRHDRSRFRKVRDRNEARRRCQLPDGTIVQKERKSNRTVGRFPIFV